MKSVMASSAYFFAFLASVVGLEALFASWWDLDEDSLLPLMAAAGALVPLLYVARLLKPRWFRPAQEWPENRIVAWAAILAACFFVFLLVWGVLVDEPRNANIAWSAGGAAAVFAAMVIVSYVERLIRAREARKRGIAPEDYKPGKLARRTGSVVVVLLGIYLTLGLLFELSEAFS
jgi:hypothetical protein